MHQEGPVPLVTKVPLDNKVTLVKVVRLEARELLEMLDVPDLREKLVCSFLTILY